MTEKKEKKIDRRTLYTRMVIKDALLSLLAEKEYADVTIADLCREAEINRGTFYLHYDHLREVIDELFDDALQNMNGVLVQIGCAPEEKKCGVPLCRFLRENKKYRPLFFSDSLHDHVIERIAASGWDSFSAMKCRKGSSEKLFFSSKTYPSASLSQAAVSAVTSPGVSVQSLRMFSRSIANPS